MKRMIPVLVASLVILLLSGSALAQLGGPRELRRINAQPDEMISMTRSMPFNQAIMIFNDLAQRKLNKILIDPRQRVIPIGIDIENMHWLDALEMILRQNGLWYEENPDHILITEEGGGDQLSSEERSSQQMFRTREVLISAMFFEADLNKVRSLGMDWSFVNPDSLISVVMDAAQDAAGVLTVSGKQENSSGTLEGAFKVFESRSLGEVIASPRVSVASETEGRIQIGTDFSVTTTDFAGNTITTFYSSGSIITVTPRVMTVDTTTFIQLAISAEKSSAGRTDLGIEIAKTSTKTSVLLLDGEETLIGGLYSTDENLERKGVPILKDLPWWVFGLRYVFGYESTSNSRRELMILIRAELIPSLEERIAKRISRDGRPLPVLKDARENFERDIQNYKDQADTFDRKEIVQQEKEKREATPEPELRPR